MRPVSIEESLVFSASALFATAILFAIFAMLVAVGFVHNAPTTSPSSPAVIGTLTTASPLLLPVAVVTFTLLFAAPSALVAGMAFYICARVAHRFQLSSLVFLPVGALSGAVGSVVVFASDAYVLHSIGAVVGLLASVSPLLRSRQSRKITRAHGPRGDA